MNQMKDEIFEKYPEFNSLEEIREYLSKSRPLRSKFKMILLIGGSVKRVIILSEFKTEFDLSKSEDLYKIKKIDKKTGELSFLGYILFLKNYDDSSSFVIFTYATSKQVERYFFNHFVNKNSLINVLWITHKLTMDLVDLFYHDRVLITKIKGYYSPSFEEKSKIRPDFYREIEYKGRDALLSFYELRDLYGINIERFKGRLRRREFQFTRIIATISFKQGNLDKFIEITEWLFEQSNYYLKEIRKFKKNIYESMYLNRKYMLSTNLFVEFSKKLTNEVLNELVKVIKSSPDIEIISLFSKNNIEKYRGQDYEITEDFYQLKLLNRKKEGIFAVHITPSSAEITQIFNTNFIGVFPILDILDYTQPDNRIYLIEN